ncbi:MAG: hypothetical protein EBU85_07210, partial [Actinobacteria bacterium]|nr:hypothetical protein [Actinomycetota bacterium]
GTTYGKLYNWYAVNDSRGLCPTGWHVSTDSEWNVMVKYLDPNADTAAIFWQNTNAGTALNSTTWWNYPNTGATNSSGFTGLPGGVRGDHGGFINVGNDGVWWSSSDAGSGTSWYRNLNHDGSDVVRYNADHRGGFSVRCARD